MQEITRVVLDNELDLILAHKRTMKLAEMAGLTLSAQTTFATAVSEVSRIIIEGKRKGFLTLGVETDQNEKYLVATLKDEQLHGERAREGIEYAKRLVNKFKITTAGKETAVELSYYIAPPFRIDIQKLDEWRSTFRNEPPISPYEELKRKNEQLQDLSQKVQKSEGQYKTLTNTLPLFIFSLDFSGQLLYANEWLMNYTGESMKGLSNNRWKNVVFPDDYNSFELLLKNGAGNGTEAGKTQARFKNIATGEYLWHQVSLSPFKDEKGDIQYWIGFIVDIHAQKVYEDTLKDNIELKHTKALLEDKQLELETIIGELNRSNKELEQFAYIASHDLQEPVRKLLYYSDFLQKKYSQSIDEKGLLFLEHIHSSAARMRTLILDLLSFSQVNSSQVVYVDTDMNLVAETVMQDMGVLLEQKKGTLTFDQLPAMKTDERMMRQLFENLVSNGLKFSREGVNATVNVSYKLAEGFHQFCFSDNGIGFDQKHEEQMFHLFQRLHSRDTYPGTGLGLAICRKIVELQGGKIWAKSRENAGSDFYVSIPVST